MKKLFFTIVLLFFTISVFGNDYHIRRTDNFTSDEEMFHNRWTNSIRGDSLNCTVVGRVLFGVSYNVFVKDTIAYSCHGYSLIILNVSDPSNSILIGFYDTGGYARGVYVQDTIAYVAADDDGLRLINVSNPTNPTEIGFYDTGDYARGVYVQDTIAYVAADDDGLRLINVSNPTNPTEIGFYDTGGSAKGVYVKDTIAYVAYSGDGLRLINVSNPTSPTEIGFYDTGSSARGVYVKDTIAYVADGSDGLRLINVSDPASPTEIGFYNTGGSARGVYVKDTIAYVADCGDGLYIIHYYGNTGIKENKNKNSSNVYNISVKMQDGLSINYNISETKSVSINIYNIAGQELYCNNSIKSPGQYSVRWNGNTGVYFVKIDIDKYRYTKKVIIIK